MDAPKLRFTHDLERELDLAQGVHAIGRIGEGVDAIGLVEDDPAAMVRFCVDRRGVWLRVAEGARGVHVNGRPVQRMAMLRLGDAIYLDGAEMLLVSGVAPGAVPTALQHAPGDVPGDPRVVLRGVGGQYHGRSFTLEAPRLVGRAADAHIRIDDPAFAERHARLELVGDVILLRDLGSADGSMVNGLPVRDAVLHPGDQVVFEGHHRFVVEAPKASRSDPLPSFDEEAGDTPLDGTSRTRLRHAARRLPWLLLAAVMLAGALSALLLFGSH